MKGVAEPINVRSHCVMLVDRRLSDGRRGVETSVRVSCSLLVDGENMCTEKCE